MERCVLSSLLLATAAAAHGPAQTVPVKLPPPQGEYAVGTVTYCWPDEARRFSYSTFADDLRRVALQIWFPAAADPRAERAPYSALSADYRHVVSNSSLWPAFAADLAACPLVLISPGRGVERFGYTTIAESLASHGYVVAAVDMPGIGYVIYPEGLIVKPDPAFSPSRELMGGPYEKVDEFFEKPTEIGARDLEFALDCIGELQESDPSGRFVGRIDMSRVGIFGHSLGGRIAGALAARDERVRAYISMEGIAPRAARFDGLALPVAMMCSSGTLPYAIDNYQSLIDGRRDVVYLIELQKFGHNSVTDFPYVTPGQFNYEVDPLSGLLTSVAIIQAFFDVHLSGSGSFTEECSQLAGVAVTQYAAPRDR